MRYGPTFFRRKETYEKSSVQEAVFRAACADNGGRSAARVSAGGGGKQNNQTTTSNFPCNFNFAVSNMNRFNQGIYHG